MANYRRFAWFTLGFNVLVILWGAFVRATGSGAGCGDHWPLCNGSVVPAIQRVNTMIEFGHRITSGLALLLVLGLFFYTRRLFPRGSFTRRAAGYSLIAIVLEALIGAGIVLLRLVEHDQSLDRAVSIALHLVNTLFLVAALALTALSPAAATPRWRWPNAGPDRAWSRALLVTFALLGALGALTALGDTLFPVTNLAQEFREKFEARRHFLQHIRVFHPILAVLWAGALWLWLSGLWARMPFIKPRSTTLLWIVVSQLVFGMLNVALLAPIWLQLVHLLWADIIWIFLVSTLFLAASEWRPEGNSGIPKGTS
jgi:heme a synthase